MGKMLTVTSRELRALFVSPIFWAVTTGFLFFFGLIFGLYVTGQAGAAPEANMRDLLGLIATIMLFVAPLLSMRLLAEERRQGTLELLMTSPVEDWQVVWGKWLAAFTAYLCMIGFTLFHVGIMLRLATNGMAAGPLFASYLGVALMGGALIALGTLTSSLTENQVVAGFLGVMLVMVFWFISLGASMAGGPDTALGGAIAYLGLADHYRNFGQGVVDSRDVLYFVSITVGSLYLAVRALEAGRWR